MYLKSLAVTIGLRLLCNLNNMNYITIHVLVTTLILSPDYFG